MEAQKVENQVAMMKWDKHRPRLVASTGRYTYFLRATSYELRATSYELTYYVLGY
jgi:hypothetical protein